VAKLASRAEAFGSGLLDRNERIPAATSHTAYSPLPAAARLAESSRLIDKLPLKECTWRSPMANETSALRGEPQQTSAADDYQSFSAALGASARGRAFLHEYARRNRHADTEVVLAALDRLESVARSQKSAPEAERIRQDLRALLDTIRSARPQIDTTPGAIKAATLAALLEFVQARIEALVQPMPAQLMPVPELEQPELPIPQPGSAAQRTIALVQAIAPPPEPLPQPALREVQPFVLTVEPRLPPAKRNFDPEALLAEPPRSTRIIPEVNFIDSLFDAIDAKAQEKAKAAKPADPIVVPPPAIAVPAIAAPAVAVPAVAEAPKPLAVVLPPIDLTPVAVAPVEETAKAGATVALAEAGGDTKTDTETKTVGMAESIARASTTAAAINASADAIDSIVAAAEAALAEEAARAEAACHETAFVETFIADSSPVSPHAPAKAEPAAAAAAAPAPATSYLADAIGKSAVTGPSPFAMDNALSAIMALSEEERLAMFT
jgi:hypothetical protein